MATLSKSLPSVSGSRIPLVCDATGIRIDLIAPSVPGFVLTYKNPLADIRNAMPIAKKGAAYLNQFEPQILAGLFLTIYGHFYLLQFGALPSRAAANQLLRTCNNKETLIYALTFAAKHFTSSLCARLPRFSVESLLTWRPIADESKLGAIRPYLDSCKPYLLEISELEEEVLEAADKRITIHRLSVRARSQVALAKFEISKDDPAHSVHQAEIDFELQFKELRKEACSLVKNLPEELPAKMLAILQLAAKDRNLVTMSSELREKLRLRLKQHGAVLCLRLAEILRLTHNPYDIFGEAVDSGLSNLPKEETKAFSIAELLAKRRGELA